MQQAPLPFAPAAAGGPSPMDVDAPAGAPVVGGAPDWNRIPADVIGHLLRWGQLDERDARSILATSSQWRAAAKEQLPALSPLFLGSPAHVAPTAFRGVAALNCRALRARGFGASRRQALPTGDSGGGSSSGSGGGAGTDGGAGGADACAAGSSSGGGAGASSGGGAAGWDDADSRAARVRAGAQPLPSPHGAPRPHIFLFAPPVGDLPGRLAAALPRVAAVDLSGQELPPGSGAALGGCAALKELQLRSCRVGFDDLAQLLRALRAPGGAALRVLGVGDIRVRGAPEGVSPGGAAASIGLPPSLRSLHAGLFLRARERPAAISDRLDLRGHLAALLAPLGRLNTLGLDEQRLEAGDWEAVTNATGLRDLSASWWPPGPDGGLDPAHLRRLAALPRLARLRLALRGRGGFYEPLSLAGLSALRELELSGCRSLPLALSLAELTGLERLVLTACGEAVSTNVLVMILRSTPNLQLLSLRSMALNQELRAPGDELLHHLAACCPRLKSLMLGDTAALGTGLRQPGAWAAAAMGLGGSGGGGGLGGGWLRGLTEVELCGTQLLRSSLLHLSSLESLECLTLRSVPPVEFAHAARLGCLRGLSQLGRTLRTLRVIASADAPAPGPREPHLHFLTALTALEHLELGVLHSSGACLSHLAPLTRLRSLHAGGALHLTRLGVAALAALRLPHLETLSLVDLAWRQPWEGPAGGTGTGMVVNGGGGGGGGPAVAAAGRISSGGGGIGGCAGASGSGTGGGEDEAPALAVLRALPGVAPGLRYLRLGSCSGATAGPLAEALAALPGLEALQLLELPVLADDLIAALTGHPALSSCCPSAPFGAAAAAAAVQRKPRGPRPLVGVDVRSSEELAQMRAAGRATAGLVAAAAAGGGDLLEASAGHASVEAAAAAIGQAAPWPAVPAGGQGGGGPGGGGPGGAGGGGGGGGGAAGGAVAAAFAAAAGLAGWGGGGEGAGGAGGGQGPPTATRGRLYSYRLTRTATGALVVQP